MAGGFASIGFVCLGMAGSLLSWRLFFRVCWGGLRGVRV